MSGSTQSSKSTQSAAKRLINELHSYQEEPDPLLLRLGPVRDDDLFTWEAVMKGPPGTPYEDGLFHLAISLPQTYPLAPPSLTFTTPVCHPNVHFRTGEICLDLLKDGWSPAYTVAATVGAVRDLLAAPEPDSPLNVEAAVLVRLGEGVGWEGLVRFYCEAERYGG